MPIKAKPKHSTTRPSNTRWRGRKRTRPAHFTTICGATSTNPGCLAGLHSTNISVVDWAKASDRPAKPVVPLYLAGSILLGLVVGVSAALLRDVTDTKIQDLREISRELAMPLSVLPFQKERACASPEVSPGSKNRPCLHSIVPSRSSSNRFARCARLSCSPAAERRPGPCCSPVPWQGKAKATLAGTWPSSLPSRASACSCVDANLRHPSLHRNLEVDPRYGLSSLLAGTAPDDGRSVIIPVLEVPGLYIVPAGPLPPYPADLLASRQMADLVRSWEAEYDLVLLDAPPVLQFTDSVILSSID